MKVKISKRLINVYLSAIFFLAITITNAVYAQCGTETFTVVDWCENGYAEWTITNPDPAAKYHWYEPIYDATGTTIVDTLDRNYGENATGTHFISPYRYTTPSPVPSAPNWDYRKFWYVEEKSLTGFISDAGGGGINTSGPTQTTGYTMAVTASTEIRYNYLSIPVKLYTPANTFSIQLQIGSNFTQRYDFTGSSAISLGNQSYLVAVPVNITMPAGTYNITAITNPTGAINPVDGLVWADDNAFTGTTFTNTGITSAKGSLQSIWGGNHRSLFYDWDYTSYCPYTYTPVAKKTTVGCCVPVVSGVVVSASAPIIVSGTDNSILTVTSYGSASDYFQWYKDGTLLSGKTGLSITVNQAGVYAVREVKSASDLSKVSCYSEGSTLVQERSLFAKVNNPKASYCVGDKVNIEAYGTNINNVVWTPASLAASPNSLATDVTLSTPGTLTFTATADVFLGNPIVNGDFEAGNTGFTSDMTNTTGTPSSGQYRIDTYVTEQQSYWATSSPGNPATQTKGTGKFLYSDGFQTYQTGSDIWKETVNISAGKNYTFSMDHANISWNADPSNTARVADIDTKFDIYINGVKIATFTTDGQGQYAGVGRWKTDQVVWNSGTSTQAVIEIKQQVKGGAGYDFAIDNILFGGPVTQTATVNVGIISDCYAIKDSVGACMGSTRNLYAKAINTVTGAEVGVIDRWQQLPGNTVVGTGKSITITPPATTTKYVVFGYFPAGSLIQNGDFELGPNGFNYGSANGLYNLATGSGIAPGSIGIVTNPKVTTNNAAYASMGDHTSGTGNMLLVDPQSADGNVIQYNFNANAGQNYLLSLWAANAVDFTQNPNGISASLSFIINGPGVTNLQISSVDLPRNNAWMQLSNVWKPATTGAYTLTVRAKGDATLAPIQSASTGQSISGGNDFVLDDIQLAEPTSKVYTDTVTVAPCVNCKIPNTISAMSKHNLLKGDTVCVGSPFTLQKNVIDTTGKASGVGGYYYYWAYAKTYNAATKTGTGYSRLTAPLKLTALPVNNSDYIKASSVLADSGYYFLVIQDGPGLAPVCKDSAVAAIRVNQAPTTKGLIASNQEICKGSTVAAFTEVKAAAGATGSPVLYKWYTSSDSVAAVQTKISAATGNVYTPATPASTTYYVRKDSVAYCALVKTNFVKVEVNNKPLLNKIIPVLRDTLCVGEKFNLSTTINLADSTGVNASFNGGYYFIWKKYQAGVLITTKGPAPYKKYLAADAAVTLADSGLYYLIVQDGFSATKCKDTIKLRIVVNQGPTTKGLIASNQEICKGSTAAAFTEIQAGVGIVGSPLLYKWYTSSDSVSAAQTKISGATNNLYAPAAATPATTTYYVRKDSVAYCAAVKTNFVKVEVNNKPILNKIIPALRDTLCIGENFNLSTTMNLVDSTGVNASFNGGYYFTWQKYQAGVLKTTKGPAPYKNYLAAVAAVTLADSGLYYLIVQDGFSASACKDTISLRISVNQAPLVKGIIQSNQEICKGDPAAIITEKAAPQNFVGNPLNYQWYTTADSTGTPVLTRVFGSTANSYNPGSPISTQYYVRTDSIKYCAAVKTNFVKVRVNNSVILDSIKPFTNDTLCTNLGDQLQILGYVDSIAAGKASINGGYYFTWMQLRQPATTPVIVGTPGKYVNYPAAPRTVLESDSGTYYLIVQDGAGATKCQDTLKIKIVVYNNCIVACSKPNLVSTQLLAGTNDTLCAGSSLTIQKNVIDTTGVPSSAGYYFSWKKSNSSGSVIVTGPAATYSDLVIPAVTEQDSGRYYLIVQDGLTADPSCQKSSAPISIAVNKPIAIPAVIASSDTICEGSVPVKLIEKTPASGSTGIPYRYQWYASTDSFKTTAGTSILVTANTQDYQPPVLSVTTYYRRIDSVGVCPAAKTNILTIQIDKKITRAQIGNDTVICAGNPLFAFKEITANTGGTGNFIYKWQSSLDNSTFTDIAGATAKTYQAVNVVDTTFYRRIDSSGVCPAVITDTIEVDVVTGVNPGTVSGPAAAICYNTIPPTGLTSLSAASGGSGGPGSDTYQWQQSTDNVVWTDISGATGLNLTMSVKLTQSTSYRRRVGMGSGNCDTSYTIPIVIKVYEPLTPGSLGNDITICSGKSVAITEITAATGGGEVGAQTYQWIASADNGFSWSNAAGTSDQSSYTTGVLTDTVIYKRIVTAVCGKDTTNATQINVDSINHVNVSVMDVETCNGEAVTFTATPVGGGTTPQYVWQKAPAVGGPWTAIPTAANADYTVTNPLRSDSGSVYKVTLTSSYTCVSGTAEATGVLNVHTIVVPKVTVSSNPSGAICDFVKTITYTATPVSGQGTAPKYQWYDGKTNTRINGETNATYTPAAKPAKDDKVYVIMQTNATCASMSSVSSNILVLNVKTVPNPSISTKDTSICSPYEVTLYTGNTAFSGTTFQWYKDGVQIPGGTNATYIVSATEIPGGDYALVEDNGTCNNSTNSTSVKILSSPTVDVGPDIYAVEGELVTLNGSVTNATSYIWTPGGSLSDPYSLNPQFKASGTITYLLQAFNNGGKCEAGKSLVVYVESAIKIANVLTVNGDGNNDTWKIEHIENYPNVTFEIFNRWGNIVWKSSGYTKQWDGTNYRNGEVLPDGTYFYVIDLHSQKFTEPYTGWIQIVK